ncbi:hypothetical protein MY11210_009521, partial [Beauveria gryllotalpidicola]
MKSAAVMILQAVSLATALSRGDVSYAEAEALCGALGVMDVPEGVDSHTVRACREHPVSTETHSLEKRACWQGKAVGCSKSGWCYKRCDKNWSGPWCWTTVNGPLSSWKSCKRDKDCS